MALCSSHKYIKLKFAAACLGRVLTDHYTPDEGTRPSGIWKGDTCSFPNIESKYPLFRVHGTDEESNKSLPVGCCYDCYFLLQEVDSMRSAYYSDLCSKFMIENTILKMEYAEVRVFSISEKVGSEL